MTREQYEDRTLAVGVLIFGAPAALGLAAQYLLSPEQAAWGAYEITGFAVGGLLAVAYVVTRFAGSRRR